jgi:predicted MFS family arabinose efflux permease
MTAEARLAAGRSLKRPWHSALAGFSSLLLGIGLSRFGYTPIIPALIGAHWFSAADAAYLGAANLMGYLVGAALAHRLAQHLPPIALVKAAMLLAAACFFACALDWGFLWYFVWRLAAGITGGVLMVLAPSAVLAVTPAARRGRVAGTIFTGVGVGAALSGTLVPWLVGFGLPTTWVVLGCAGLALTALAWQGWPDETAAMRAEKAHGATRPRLTASILLLMGAYATIGLGFVPHTVFWVDYIARGLGRGLASGGFYWVLMGSGAVCGPLLCGLAAERIGFAHTFALALPLLAALVALPLLSTQPLFLALSSLGVGAVSLGTTALGSGAAAELVPVAQQRQLWGWMTMVYAVAYAGSGYALSFLFARSGDYRLLFALGAAGLLLGTCLALPGALKRRVRTAR